MLSLLAAGDADGRVRVKRSGMQLSVKTMDVHTLL